MNDDISGFYNDDGSKINPELVPKPGLCLTCKKDDEMRDRRNPLHSDTQ